MMSVRQLFMLWFVVSSLVGVFLVVDNPEILTTQRGWQGIGIYIGFSLMIFAAAEIWALCCVPRPGKAPERPRPITANMD